MSETKQTTIRFAGTIYHRLELASQRTGLTINSIVTVACLDWLRRHEEQLSLWEKGQILVMRANNGTSMVLIALVTYRRIEGLHDCNGNNTRDIRSTVRRLRFVFLLNQIRSFSGCRDSDNAFKIGK